MVNPRFSDFSYSIRRYYVDDFYTKNITLFPKYSSILDIGGKKNVKRGQFNIENYDLNVKYVNIDEKTNPDYLCKAACIPVESCSFDGVICAELIEHVPDPKAVLAEAYRVLKLGGTILSCMPFMYRIHADPYDYGRYTDFFYLSVLKELGFENILIEKQGLFFSVLADMAKIFVSELQKENRPKGCLRKKLMHKTVSWFSKIALDLDKKEYYVRHKVFDKFTTGFGIVARKGECSSTMS